MPLYQVESPINKAMQGLSDASNTYASMDKEEYVQTDPLAPVKLAVAGAEIGYQGGKTYDYVKSVLGTGGDKIGTQGTVTTNQTIGQSIQSPAVNQAPIQQAGSTTGTQAVTGSSEQAMQTVIPEGLSGSTPGGIATESIGAGGGGAQASETIGAQLAGQDGGAVAGQQTGQAGGQVVGHGSEQIVGQAMGEQASGSVTGEMVGQTAGQAGGQVAGQTGGAVAGSYNFV